MVLLSQTGLKAQEEIVYNQYYYNYYLVNPAVAGAERCTHFMWTGYLGFSGVDGSRGETPRFTTLSFRTRLRGGLERLGIGAYAYLDQNGYSLRRGGQVSLGYHIPLSGSSTRGYMMKQRDITRQLSFALACVVNGYGYAADLCCLRQRGCTACLSQIKPVHSLLRCIQVPEAQTPSLS